MKEPVSHTVERVNARLAELLELARGTLRGEATFEAEDARALRTLLEEMAPVMARSLELRREHPETAGALDLYRRQLVEVQKAVERLRITLLVRRTALKAEQTQLTATSKWFAAFQQTC